MDIEIDHSWPNKTLEEKPLIIRGGVNWKKRVLFALLSRLPYYKQTYVNFHMTLSAF